MNDIANRVVKTGYSEEDELQHYGKIGMKWGKSLHGYGTRSLGKQTTKVVRKFDKGRATKDDASTISRRVRKEKYKLETKVKRAQKYLDKAAKADAQQIVNRFNKNPEKRALVKDYMDTMKGYSKSLEEHRLNLIDVRI